jgi:DNA-binding PadR family transcriptional regulator
MIIEVSHADDTKRRYYKLSNSGTKALQDELEYYEGAVNLARKRKILQALGTYVQTA